MQKVIVKVLSINDVKKNLSCVLKQLSITQQQDSVQYKLEDDYLRSVAGYYLINKYTSDKDLQFNEFGKPEKDGEFFNLAHSGEYVIFAQFDKPIGVDIEKIRDYKPKLLDYVCNEQDKKQVKTKDDFFVMWTQKESLIKCVGTGLAKGDIKNVPAFPIGKKKYNGKQFFSCCKKVYDYVVSVCVEQNPSIDMLTETEQF